MFSVSIKIILSKGKKKMGWAKVRQTSCKFSSSKSFIRIIEFGFCPPLTEIGGIPKKKVQ